MYFEFDDVRRIHQPYTDPFFRSKLLELTHQCPCGRHQLTILHT